MYCSVVDFYVLFRKLNERLYICEGGGKFNAQNLKFLEKNIQNLHLYFDKREISAH